MAEPKRGKFFSRLLFFLGLISVFWLSSNLFAIPSPKTDLDQNSSGMQAHFHQQLLHQPKSQPMELDQPKTLHLDVTGARLSCSENDCSHHHQGCNLEISYRLSSEVQPNFDVGAHVVCRARLDYITSHGYHLKSERCSSPAGHTLHQTDHIDSMIEVEFQFSPYEQVVDAQVESIQCHIEQAELILNSQLR